MKRLIHLIAAARPNFMKVAPLYHALKKEQWADPVIVHTGQHYDLNMSDVFFRELGLPEPHHHLGIGSGSHAEQTGNVLITYEKLLHETRPDMIVVVGDVNSTVACTLAAVKITYDQSLSPGSSERSRIRPIVAHLEAGLRSFDRTMPEEINRIVTDSIADILWTPSPDADENLLREGIATEKIERVGNIMIDSFEMMRSKIDQETTFAKYGLEKNTYALVTLHRPSNVDDPDKLEKICQELQTISQTLPIVFPIHPRTKKSLKQNGLWQKLKDTPNFFLDNPLPYIQFMSLVCNSRLLITDSGGIQEETTYLGIPCFTLRENTERPITVTEGTNQLSTPDTIEVDVRNNCGDYKAQYLRPELWDGQTAKRLVVSIRQHLEIE